MRLSLCQKHMSYFSPKTDQWYASVCVFSMNYFYEDPGDIDNYIDSCGEYMMTIASALTMLIILEL